jgi:hypothetical protein
MFIQDPNPIFPSRIQGQKIPDPHQRIQVFLNQKIVSRLSESRMFIPDPGFSFSPIPDLATRSKKAPDPGSPTLQYIIILDVPTINIYYLTYLLNKTNYHLPGYAKG